MSDLSFHNPTGPDDDLPEEAFFVESHIATAMPSAHWHDHVELNFLPKGQMDYLMNGRRVTLGERRLGVFWAAIHHQAIRVEPNQRLFCAYVPIGLFLSLPLDSAFRGAVLKGELVQAVDPGPADQLRLAEMIAGWEVAPQSLRQIYRDEVLLRLRRMSHEPVVTTRTEAATGRGASGRTVAHVERMTAFINDHLASALSVEDVAIACGLHPTSARAAFRKVLGLGIGAYLRRQRLFLAMRLLAETDLGLAEIAHLAGYSSLPRLYDAFQSQVGKTPRRFRAEVKGG